MPILPENKSRYPSNWKEIRKQILKRAENRCEKLWCGLENHSFVLRCNESDDFIEEDHELVDLWKFTHTNSRRVKVVLTIAHLDHTPENCDPENLRAWCQKCHNSYDAKHRAETRRKRKNV